MLSLGCIVEDCEGCCLEDGRTILIQFAIIVGKLLNDAWPCACKWGM